MCKIQAPYQEDPQLLISATSPHPWCSSHIDFFLLPGLVPLPQVLSTHTSIYFFILYVLKFYYVLGSVTGTEDTAVNKHSYWLPPGFLAERPFFVPTLNWSCFSPTHQSPPLHSAFVHSHYRFTLSHHFVDLYIMHLLHQTLSYQK